jgi:HPt (histidine-containing phosphotransfer) domain-containing protein
MRSQDRERVSRLSHKLKGAAANMYAETVRAASAEVEQHATVWSEPELQEQLKRLSFNVRHAIASLKELIREEGQQRSA